MINFSQLNELQVLMFALILLRMTAFTFSAAILSAPNISVFVKIGFSVIFTMLVFHLVASPVALVRLHESEDQLLMLSAREVMVGLALGFATRIFFFAISTAGEIASLSMGLSQSQIFNPVAGSMGNVMEHFYLVIGTLIYLSLQGHHVLIYGLAQSFSTIEIARASFQVGALPEMVLKAQDFFVMAIKISAPILISMLVVQVGVALLSRVVPQINVLPTSSTITSGIGIVVLAVSLPLLVMQITGLIDLTSIQFLKFLKAI